MGEDKESSRKFVVKDRRRFDSDGVERDSSDSAPEATSKAAPSRTAASGPAVSSISEAPPPKIEKQGVGPKAQGMKFSLSDEEREAMAATAEGELTFSSFVISLATQTLMQLGEIQPPPGMQVPIDRESARHTIEILGMLDQKTRGNLSTEEMKLMEEVLHNLRLSYVRAAKGA